MLTLLGVMAITIALGIPIAFSIAISGVFYLLFQSSVPVLVLRLGADRHRAEERSSRRGR